jgi:hypothetical protein
VMTLIIVWWVRLKTAGLFRMRLDVRAGDVGSGLADNK